MRMSLGYKPFVVAGAAVQTWDPTVNTADLTYSNGNLRVTGGAGALDTPTISTLITSPNKSMFEATFVADATRDGIGVFTSVSLSDGILFSNGNAVTLVGGSPAAFDTIPACSDGDVLAVCHDKVSGLAWLAINGVIVAGSPSAGTGGYAAPAADCYAFATVRTGGVIDLNSGQTAFVYGLPAGFSARG